MVKTGGGTRSRILVNVRMLCLSERWNLFCGQEMQMNVDIIKGITGGSCLE